MTDTRTPREIRIDEQIAMFNVKQVVRITSQQAMFVITQDGRVYSTGFNNYGTLGYFSPRHYDFGGYEHNFRLIESLVGYQISKITGQQERTLFLDRTEKKLFVAYPHEDTEGDACVDSKIPCGVVDVVCGRFQIATLTENGLVFVSQSITGFDAGSKWTRPQFTHLVIPAPVCSIVSGGSHFIAKDEHHQIWGWGFNNKRQLGLLKYPEKEELLVSEPAMAPELNTFEWDVKLFLRGTLLINKNTKCSIAFGDTDNVEWMH